MPGLPTASSASPAMVAGEPSFHGPNMDTTMKMNRKKAREIAIELRNRGSAVSAWTVRRWPVGRLRDALLWIRIYDAGDGPVNGFDVPSFDYFFISRESLRRCGRCHCTEDSPDLCAACAPAAAAAPAALPAARGELTIAEVGNPMMVF